MVKFILGWEFGIKRALTGANFRFKRGQAVIALRAHHQINNRCTSHDLATFGLGDATGNGHFHVWVIGFDLFYPPQIGIKLFSSFFADVAGVEQHHISAFDVIA